MKLNLVEPTFYQLKKTVTK